MRDFWASSGFHLLRRDENGRLAVTDDFLRAYLSRPELVPVEESCAAEIALHRALLESPRLSVPPEHIAHLADSDARENYQVVLAFRDRLIRHGTVEACYLSLFGAKGVTVPPLFIDQMVHVICRNILDGIEDAMQLRAAELLFRAQKVSIQDGTIMLADEEIVGMYAGTGGFGRLGKLLAEAQTPMRNVQLDVLTEQNGACYWERSDRYDTVLDLTFARPGLDALCRVLEAWIAHFLDTHVSIQPVQAIADERWVWHVGLDVEASGILNDLYQGRAVDDARLGRLLSLFRLEFRDPTVMRTEVVGRPVYLGLAATPDDTLRMKPQNLLVNLPVTRAA